MPRFCRTAIHEAAHELTQRGDVKGAVFHLIVDVVVRSLGKLLAFLVTTTSCRVVDRLALIEKLNGPIDPFRFWSRHSLSSQLTCRDCRDE